jgi:hypothetical protein
MVGMDGLGKTMLGKLLIYELCGRLEADQRPEVLYVYRYEGCTPLSCEETVHIELMYYTGVPRVKRLCCPLHQIPANFWQLRYSSRPLYVIVDTCLPRAVMHTIQEGNHRWFAQMKLFVYLASPLRQVQAECARSAYDWPFYNTSIVPSMTLGEYLRVGFRCADRHTREFLCETAGIGKELANSAETPPQVVPLMEYMHRMLGGSPELLFHFAVGSRLVREANRFTPQVVQIMNECQDGTDIAEEARQDLHEMCALRIAYLVKFMSQDDIARSGTSAPAPC